MNQAMIRSAAKAGLQSSSIMAVADISTQLIVEKRSISSNNNAININPNQKEATITIDHHAAVAQPSPPLQYCNCNYDPLRTLRWATVGLTLHGPYFFFAFAKLDRLLPPVKNNLLVVAKKTTIAQLVIFPPYLVALFAYLGIMEGQNDVLTKVRERVPEAFVGGCFFWPIANFINFSFVPAGGMRVPYLATVGGLWNGYLSYMNARSEDDHGNGGTESN